MTDIKSIAIYILLAAVAALGAAAWFSHERAGVAVGQRDLVTQRLKTTTDAVDAQKRLAATQLAAVNASVLAQQKRLDAAYQSQEKKDAVNTEANGRLRTDLARLRGAARRLLDSAEDAGRGSGGSDAGGQAVAGAQLGSGNRAEAAWLVPVPTDQEAAEDDEAYDADQINAAYASCRADAVNVRRMTAPP